MEHFSQFNHVLDLVAMICIRKFQEGDEKEISALIRLTLREINRKDYPISVIDFLCEQYNVEYIRDLARFQPVLVAVDDGELVGTITVKRGRISHVFVRPVHQGRGIGTRLMDIAEKIAKELHSTEIQLSASLTAIGFYEKLGYELGEMHDDPQYGQTYEMTKRLDDG